MGRLTDLVRRATHARLGGASASEVARAIALAVIDRAMSTGRRLGEIAEAVRPALGAAGAGGGGIEVVAYERSAAASESASASASESESASASASASESASVSASASASVSASVAELPWVVARHISAGVSVQAAALIDSELFRGDQHDSEQLRLARVASRKLRVFVGVFEGALRPKVARRLRRTLRKVGRGLGPLRECDVLAGALQARLEGVDDAAQAVAIEHVLVEVAHRRDEARVRARRVLEEIDRVQLRPDLDDAIASAIAPLLRIDADARTFAWQLLQPRIDAAFEGAPVPAALDDDAGVHEVRIQAKRLRYAYDLFAPAFDDARVRKDLKHVQRSIGAARDRRQIAAFVDAHRHALEERGHTRLAAGLAPLVFTLRAEADAALTRVPAAIEAFDRPRILTATQTALGVRPLALLSIA